MIELVLLLQADLDIQAAFERYEDYQQGRGEVFMRLSPSLLSSKNRRDAKSAEKTNSSESPRPSRLCGSWVPRPNCVAFLGCTRNLLENARFSAIALQRAERWEGKDRLEPLTPQVMPPRNRNPCVLAPLRLCVAS